MTMQAEKERQEQAGQLVAQHVLQCQSGLINDILNAYYGRPTYAQRYEALKYPLACRPPDQILQHIQHLINDVFFKRTVKQAVRPHPLR